MTREKAGRPNQRLRTRKDLLIAASRIMKQGRRPTLEEVAAEALVSRATAYRHFPNIEGLLLEASLDVAIPSPEDLFAAGATDDPVIRMQRVDTALHEMVLENETSLRMMLANSLQQQPSEGENLPSRQNRRTPLIEAALAPGRRQLKPASLPMLVNALALIVGPEAMVVGKDVLQLDDAELRKVKRWAIQALVDAARRAQ